MTKLTLKVPIGAEKYIKNNLCTNHKIFNDNFDNKMLFMDVEGEIQIELEEQFSSLSERDLYADIEIIFYGNTIDGFSPEGLAHFVQMGVPTAVLHQAALSAGNIDAKLQEKFLEVLSKEGMKYADTPWLKKLPTEESLEYYINMGVEPLPLLERFLHCSLEEGYVSKIEGLITALVELGLNLNELEYKHIIKIPLSQFSKESTEMLISRGLDVTHVFDTAFKEGSAEMLDLALNNGFDPKKFQDAHINIDNFSLEILHVLLSNSIPVQMILEKIIQSSTRDYDSKTSSFVDSDSLVAKQSELVKELVNLGGTMQDCYLSATFVKNNFEFIVESPSCDMLSMNLDISELSTEQLSAFAKTNVGPKILAKKIYDLSCPQYSSETSTHNSARLSEEIKNLIDLQIPTKASLVDYFIEKLGFFSSYIDKEKNVPIVPSAEILQYLYDKGFIDADLLFQHALKLDDLDLLKISLSLGATIHQDDKDMFGRLVSEGKHSLAEYFISDLNATELKDSTYFISVLKAGIVGAKDVIDKFGHFFDRENLIQIARAEGSSMSALNLGIDMYDLFCAYSNNTDLSPLERSILSQEWVMAEIPPQSLTNKWGYSALQLVIISGQYGLAIELIEAGHDIYQQNANENSAIDLLSNMRGIVSYHKQQEMAPLAQLIISKLTDVDVVQSDGESLIDMLIASGDEAAERIIAMSKDPLIALYKEGVDFDAVFNDGLTHIAIGNGEDFWSTGVWSGARLLMQHHPEVVFHLITLNMVTQYGNEFLDRFDAFISPGSSDIYPDAPFKLEDFCNQASISQIYQIIINKAKELDAPFLGMCGGAQHLVLNNGGTIESIKGYDHGQREITFIPGTLSYYMALTDQQKKDMLENKIFPEIKFKGDTAHRYAASAENYGSLTLGAVSEEGVPMAYSSNIHFATQFHPEHFLHKRGLDDENATNQIAWLDSFISLAVQNHNDVDIIGFMQEIQNHMDDIITSS